MSYIRKLNRAINNMRFIPVLSLLLMMTAGDLRALPISFGINQGDLEYHELNSKNFSIYHDARTPHEAKLTLESLEAVRPLYEQWFDVKREQTLPVIISAETSNASFADFITDAIELQTMGQGSRDLAWHEYTHSTMYRHLDNWFGPPGAILHLPWMTAWWLEGLAESMTVSIGSNVQSGIERYQAHSGDWPTYDRMHSLYDSDSDFGYRGYAIAGAFVSYLLKKFDAKDALPAFHRDFFHYSLPWWWLSAASPFGDFMPMEKALEKLTASKDSSTGPKGGLTGKELWEMYKKAAKDFWDKNSPAPYLLDVQGSRQEYANLGGLTTQGSDAFIPMLNDDGWIVDAKIQFDPKTGWAISSDLPPIKFEDNRPSIPALEDKNVRSASVRVMRVDQQGAAQNDQEFIASIKAREHRRGLLRDNIMLARKGSKDAYFSAPRPIFESEGIIYGLFETRRHLAWMEQKTEHTSFCYVDKKELFLKKKLSKKIIRCPLQTTIPHTLEVLGVKKKSENNSLGFAEEIWLSLRTQTLLGDRFNIVVWSPETLKKRVFSLPGEGEPLTIAFAGNASQDIWMLTGERSFRTLKKITPAGQCLGQVAVSDHPTNVIGFEDGSIALGLYAGNSRVLMRLDKTKMKETPCINNGGPTSPVLYALRKKHKTASKDPKATTFVDVHEALKGSSTWVAGTSGIAGRTSKSAQDVSGLPKAAEENGKLEGIISNDEAVIKSAEPLGIQNNSEPPSSEQSFPAKWRGRPVLAFPWIGADDALGPQLGMVSVPLMDYMQNETARLTMLYGVVSRYPNLQLTLTSTRFWPTLNVSAYRQQSFNGEYVNEDREIIVNYYDERGGLFDSETRIHAFDGVFTLNLGMKAADLKPYLGLENIRYGSLYELTSRLEFSHDIGKFGTSTYVSASSAPTFLNKNFSYNVIGFGSTVSRELSLFSSSANAGFEVSKTRGSKRKLLKEAYRPLKTFVPGSGGGYNKNSFEFLGAGSLLSARYGSSQGRLKANWIIPVVKNLNKLFWILYLQRLDFTAFYNYGGAWYDTLLPDESRLMHAHGYNLDLQLENKGVRFNLGIGSGQVVGDPFQVYITTGFDALF